MGLGCCRDGPSKGVWVGGEEATRPYLNNAACIEDGLRSGKRSNMELTGPVGLMDGCENVCLGSARE